MSRAGGMKPSGMLAVRLTPVTCPMTSRLMFQIMPFARKKFERQADRGTARWATAAGLLLCAAAGHPVWLSRAAKLCGDFGSHTLYQSLVAVAAVLLLRHGWRSSGRRLLWWPFAVSLGTFLCVEGLKRATRLPRPDGEPTGFPSGHTTFAFALAWLLSLVCPRLRPLWFGVAVCIGWSRMEGLAHFPYQVLCGVVLGTLIGWCISYFIPSGEGR